MGYFDGLVASSYKEEDGHHYILGFGPRGKPMRFLSKQDYERSRSRLRTYYTIGLPLLIGLAALGRYAGYGWAALGGGLMIAWLFLIGRTMLTHNAVPADHINDGVSQRLERASMQFGRTTLWLGLAISALFAAAGVWIAITAPDSSLLGLACAAIFGTGAVLIAVMLKRRSSKESSVSSIERLQKLAELRVNGILTQAEFETQKALCLQSDPTPPQRRGPRLGWILGAIGLLLVGVVYWNASGKTADPNEQADSSSAHDQSEDPFSVGDDPANRTDAGGTFTNEERVLIEQAEEAWANFRNGDAGAGERHIATLEILFDEGVCWGRVSEAQARFSFHRCAADSIQMQPLEATGSAGEPLGQRGQCQLRIEGTTYIEDDCIIQLDDDGSFQVMSEDQTYIAVVLRDGAAGQGYWNGSTGSRQAQMPLGQLESRGACWENETAEICVWGV